MVVGSSARVGMDFADFEKAVEQLTLLWANALGLREEPPTTGRGRKTAAAAARA